MAVVVALDGATIRELAMACDPGVRAPPKSYVIVGPEEIAPGLHEIAVHAELAQGAVDGAAVVSLPAIDMLDEGGAALGAEIVVDVATDGVTIAPPLVYPPKGL